MQVPNRRLGNSHGILIPKPVLKQVGLSDQVEMQVEGNTLILRKPCASPRSGWEEASKRIAAPNSNAATCPAPVCPKMNRNTPKVPR